MMATFDRITQQQFYENFSTALHKLDYTKLGSKYYPELTALKEKDSIKEVKVTDQNILD